jgi:hypothetical protein
MEVKLAVILVAREGRTHKGANHIDARSLDYIIM